MILLDTDHLSVFTDERDARHGLLNRRMEAAGDQIGCTIVSVEEVLRGWLAVIHRLRDVHRQLPPMSASDSSSTSWAIGRSFRSTCARRTSS